MRRRLVFLAAWLLACLVVAWYPPANEVPATPAPVLVTPGPSRWQGHPMRDWVPEPVTTR